MIKKSFNETGSTSVLIVGTNSTLINVKEDEYDKDLNLHEESSD